MSRCYHPHHILCLAHQFLTDRALRDVLAHRVFFGRLKRVQRPAHRLLSLRAGPLNFHRPFRVTSADSSRSGISKRRNRWMPVNILDFTVPMGTPVIAATSRWVYPP